MQLDQVLTNLIGNAFEYHHDPSSATVSVAVEEATTATGSVPIDSDRSAA